MAEAVSNRMATGAPVRTRARLESIDVLRGVVMIIMALDHTRDFFGIPGQNPTDLATASAALFLTRWVTYFCAPVFFLLTGTGAYLSLRRRSPGELSRFLLTRGLWLIFLEVVLVRCFVYQFNVDYRVTMLLVLWALGWAMITLAALVRLPVVRGRPRSASSLIAGHNLLDSVRSASPLWSILHAPGFVLNTPEHVVFVAYPLIPWIGVTAVGTASDRSTAGMPIAGGRSCCAWDWSLSAGFLVDPRHQHLRRPVALDARRRPRLHRALVPEHDQVPAVAAVPADDARTGAAVSCGPSTAGRRGCFVRRS